MYALQRPYPGAVLSKKKINMDQWHQPFWGLWGSQAEARSESNSCPTAAETEMDEMGEAWEKQSKVSPGWVASVGIGRGPSTQI
jgi:hypothetical protein